MNSRERLEIAFYLLSLSCTVLGIRTQSLLLSGPAFLGLFVGVFRGYKTALCGLAISLAVLFPGASFGMGYGRDTHITAFWSSQILEQGWPLPAKEIARGFPETPLIHSLAGVLSLVTDLRLAPGPRRVSVAMLLPAVLVSVVLFFAWSVIRRTQNTHDRRRVLTVLPLLLWVPFFAKKTAFRRQSLGIVMFAITVYLVYIYYQNTDRRIGYLLMLFSPVVVLTHHLSSMFSLAFLGSAAIIYVLNQERILTKQLVFSFILLLISFATWYVTTGLGGEFIVGLLGYVIGSITPPGGLIELLLGKGTETQPVSVRSSVWFLIRTTFSKVLFVGILGIVITAGVFTRYYREHPIILYSFIYGIFNLFLFISLFVVGIGSLTRILTFAVVALVPIAMITIHRFESEFELGSGPAHVVCLVLLLLGAMMVPASYVSEASPEYENGVVSERYQANEYNTAEFLRQYGGAEQIVADANYNGLLVMSGQKTTISDYTVVRGSSDLGDRYLLLEERNHRLFFGYYEGVWSSIRPEKPFTRASTQYSQVYSSQKSVVWRQTL